eukprot:4911042-Alexandrium_andersonii.AAC.1
MRSPPLPHAAPQLRPGADAEPSPRRACRRRARRAVRCHGLLLPCEGRGQRYHYVLAFEGRNSRAIIARLVLAKARGDEQIVGRAVAGVRRLGHRRKAVFEDGQCASVAAQALG